MLYSVPASRRDRHGHRPQVLTALGGPFFSVGSILPAIHQGARARARKPPASRGAKLVCETLPAVRCALSNTADRGLGGVRARLHPLQSVSGICPRPASGVVPILYQF